MGWMDTALKVATGLDNAQLVQKGTQVYPEYVEPNISNRPTHRLAARLMTQRFGVVPAQLGGLAMEGWEDVNSRLHGAGPAWDWGDILANLKGSTDVDPVTRALLGGFLEGGK